MIDCKTLAFAQHVIQRRLARLEHRENRYRKCSNRYSLLRALVFVLFVAAVWFSQTNESSVFNAQSWQANTTLLILFIGFVFLIIKQNRLEKTIADVVIQKNHAETDSSRINHQWDEIPRKTQEYGPESGIAHDLNIVGDRSLIHLLDTTSSIEARNFLIEQLINPSLDIEKLLWRQECVKSLINKQVLFAKLRLAGGKVGDKAFSGKSILKLLEDCKYPKWGKFFLIFSICLAVINVGLLLLFDPKYFFLSFTAYVILFFIFERHSSVTYSRLVGVTGEINRMQAMFSILENRVESNDTVLAEHLSPLRGSKRPSKLAYELNKHANALSVRAFPPAHIILNILFPWDQFFVYRLEVTRKRLLQHMRTWLIIVAQTEAYLALAHFARLNPHYNFPKLVSASDPQQKSYSAHELGHPLIPFEERVVNDFCLNDTSRIAIVTGSNMSGKSAFLRTVGINVCLAQAGSVVCASKYLSSLFHIVSCIDVTDDLDSGKSLFYREIEQLKAVLKSVNDNSNDTLFLIDEILKGTNNQERIIGGKKYLQTMSEKGGFGLVSTHDLEFANLADEVESMFNIHFTDAIVNDKMVFDRKLKQGRSSSTNALKIMEIERVI